jgi:hypothetical protein
MPARSTANQKCVDACLGARAPGDAIEAPPREVTAAAKAFAKFDAAQRLAVIPPLVRWLGLEHDWPELTLEEANAFTAAARETRMSSFLPISVAMLFGAYDGKVPKSVPAASLEAFNRGLAIMKTQRLWVNDRLYKKAPDAVPLFSTAGGEHDRIIGCFFEVDTAERRAVLLPFIIKNERWEIFDELERGFEQGKGELKAGDDLYVPHFPAHREKVKANLERLHAAALRGREVLKPIWESEGIVSAEAKLLFERSPQMKKRFGKSVWWSISPRSKSTSADDITLSVSMSRKVKESFEALGTFHFAAQRKGKGAWKFSQLEVELADERINLL